jgi:mRNA-degrading endonuclease YafQ of YafQ-DinJ toxin-antitoxin module
VFNIVTTEYFLRRAGKFLKQHPDLRERFANVVDDLKQDPLAPHLAYHPLGGKLQGFQAVTYEFRIILRIEVTEQEIILLDVGSHDDGYRQGDRPGPGT